MYKVSGGTQDVNKKPKAVFDEVHGMKCCDDLQSGETRIKEFLAVTHRVTDYPSRIVQFDFK